MFEYNPSYLLGQNFDHFFVWGEFQDIRCIQCRWALEEYRAPGCKFSNRNGNPFDVSISSIS